LWEGEQTAMSEFKKTDEDWKARAEAEKRKLEEKFSRRKQVQVKLPPASFSTIVSTFATQAMVALGDAPGEGGSKGEVDLEAARFAIDSLAVLKEKTKGNLQPEEERLLDDLLQSLRLRFVQRAREQGKVP